MKMIKATKIGIMIEIFALVIMILLALFNKIIPSILSWVFVIGLVIALAGTFVSLSKRSNRK